MIPRRPLIILAALLSLGGAIAAFVPAIAAAWPYGALLMLLVVIADAAIGALAAAPEVERHLPGSMSLSTWIDIRLTIRNQARRRMTIELFDHHPQSITVRKLPLTVAVDSGEFVDVTYRARATRRGPETFPGCDLRIASPLHLWWRRRFVAEQSVGRRLGHIGALKGRACYPTQCPVE